MNKTLEGMARAAYRAQYGAEFDSLRDGVREQFMKAAILWLANNVSDEMVIKALEAAVKYMNDNGYSATTPLSGHAADYTRVCVSAALRAAAGGGE